MEIIAIGMQLAGLGLILWRDSAYKFGRTPHALRWTIVALLLGGIALQIWIRHG